MKNKTASIPWILLALTVLVFAYIRIRLLMLPLERDEGEYAYAGQMILKGSPPYQDVYNMKFPGVYYCYALFIFLFGNTIQAIHIGALLINLLTAFFLFKAASRLRNQTAGIFTAIAFTAFSAAPGMQGLTANTEHFVNVFIAISSYFLFSWIENRRNYQLFLSGIFCGFACLMKQHGAYFFIEAFIVVCMYAKTVPLNKKFRMFFALLFGFFTVLAILLISVVLNHTNNEFIFLTMKYGWYYISKNSTHKFHDFFIVLKSNIINNLLLWVAAFFGIFFSYKSLSKKKFWVLLIWSFLSVAAVFPGYYFRNHYYLLLLPVASMYVGLFFERFLVWASNQPNYNYHLIPVTIIILCILYFVTTNYRFFIKATPNEASRYIYRDNVFNNAITISDYLRNHTKKEDKILVIGSEPEIYFYTQRQAATGYLYLYPLMEKHPFRDSMRNEFIHQSIKNKPQFIVNSRNPWYNDSLQNALLSAVIPSGYILKYYGYRDTLQHKDVFVVSGNEKNIAKGKILWEVYGIKSTL